MAAAGSLSSCMLCPRKCGAHRLGGQCGLCGADASLHLARAALHFWEEPCISGTRGSGAVFFSHCHLKCIYCQNQPIAHQGKGHAASIGQLADIFCELQSQGAHNINLVSATHYTPHVVLALRKAKRAGLSVPVVWNSSGYELPETLGLLDGLVDVFLADFKYWQGSESDASLRYSNAPDYFEVATGALDAMVGQVGGSAYDSEGLMQRGVIVRHLLLPGRLEDSKRVMDFLYRRFGTSLRYSVMSQYTPFGNFPGSPELDKPVSRQDYEDLLEHLDAMGLEDYFWQEGDAVGESFVPLWDGTGVL